MKSHSVKSNAKRAARKFCAVFAGFEPIEPVAAPKGEWFAAMRVTGTPAAETIAEAKKFAKVVGLPALVATRGAHRAPASEAPLAPRPGTKADVIVQLTSRDCGATSEQLQDATGWRRHTLRGYIAGTLRKRGFDIRHEKAEGGRYRIPAA